MAQLVLKSGDFAATVEIDVDGDITEAGVAYLLQYGFQQSLGDVVAGMKAKLEKDVDKAGKRKFNDAEIAVALHDKQAERFEKIREGKIAAGGPQGPRAVGLDKVMREVAEAALRQQAIAKKASLPKKAADLNVLIDDYLEKYAEKVRPIAQRRMDEAAALAAMVE